MNNRCTVVRISFDESAIATWHIGILLHRQQRPRCVWQSTSMLFTTYDSAHAQHFIDPIIFYFMTCFTFSKLGSFKMWSNEWKKKATEDSRSVYVEYVLHWCSFHVRAIHGKLFAHFSLIALWWFPHMRIRIQKHKLYECHATQVRSFDALFWWRYWWATFCAKVKVTSSVL